jgi:N-acetylmuramoyl-L-alanine amidase
MRAWLTGLILAVMAWLPAAAQDLSALARLDPAASSITDQGETLSITLQLSQPVPWRVRFADNPRRLIMDFREVDWSGIADMRRDSSRIADLRAGSFRPGWSRLVMELRRADDVDDGGNGNRYGCHSSN